MKTLIALAASLVINFVALGTLEWNVHQVAPAGVVTVTQLPQPLATPVYARLADRSPNAATLTR